MTAAPSGHGPVAIGTTSGGSPAEPALAVGPSGTAYTVVLQPGGRQLDFCVLPVGSTTCSPVPLKVPVPSTDLFSDPPTVLLHDGDIYVFEYIGSASDDRTGIAEYVSTDGGASFTLQPDAVSYVKGGQGTTGPVVELPGGEFGAGYVSDVTNPTFQANSLTSPSNDSQATNPPYATLNPSPATAYTVGNLGGQFASQLTGSRGVLGVFVGDGAPCPSSAHSTLVYAYAPISASTSLADLNTATGGAGSPSAPVSQGRLRGHKPGRRRWPVRIGAPRNRPGDADDGGPVPGLLPGDGVRRPGYARSGRVCSGPDAFPGRNWQDLRNVGHRRRWHRARFQRARRGKLDCPGHAVVCPWYRERHRQPHQWGQRLRSGLGGVHGEQQRIRTGVQQKRCVLLGRGR